MNLYKNNSNLNKEVDPNSLEYEFVNETTKTVYKNPVDVKDIDLSKDKKLKEKVQELLPVKEEVKEQNKDEKLVEDKTSSNNSTSLKTDNLKVDNEFKKKFLSAPKNYYTINLATITDKKKVDEFIIRNNLTENSFGFRTGESDNIIRIAYGVYPTKDEALIALENLTETKAFKVGNPYVDVIYKNQDLYQLYNQSLDNKKIENELDKNLTDQIELNKINLIKNSNKEVQKVDVPVEIKKEVQEVVPITENKNDVEKIQEVKESKIKEIVRKSDEKLYEEREFDKFNNPEFKKKFLSAPGEYYSLSLVSLKNVKDIEKFINNNSQINPNEIFTYTSGDNLDQVVVLNGIFKTKEEAQKAIKKLGDLFVSKNKSYIVKIFRKQENYSKLHGIK